jgi:hypothetical protein
MIGENELANRFSYHAPTQEQTLIYQDIRDRCFVLAKFLDEVCPDSREKSLAFTALDDVVMQANAAVARRS